MNGSRNYICPICREPFYSPTERLNHRLKYHIVYESVPLVNQPNERRGQILNENLLPWRCKICGKRFENENRRDFHFLKHGPTPFRCPKCSKRKGSAFTNESQLKRHIQSWHPGQLLFPCETCGARFACCCLLHVHAACHAQDMRCPAEDCGAFVDGRAGYNEHVAQHMELLSYNSLLALVSVFRDIARTPGDVLYPPAEAAASLPPAAMATRECGGGGGRLRVRADLGQSPAGNASRHSAAVPSADSLGTAIPLIVID